MAGREHTGVSHSRETATLSTGRTVSLPLRCRCDLHGAVATARWDRLREAVPSAFTPVRVGPKTGLVSFVGIRYREVGSLPPYDEFAVVVPVARRALSGVPLPGAALGGYVLALPVPTEEARALGEEVWGFPKEVAEVSHERAGSHRRTRVRVDGQWAVSLEVADARERRRSGRLAAYTVDDEAVRRVPVDLAGAFGVGPGVGLRGGFGVDAADGSGDRRTRIRLGGGDLGNRLRRLGLGVPLVRFVGDDVRARVHPGERVR